MEKRLEFVRFESDPSITKILRRLLDSGNEVGLVCGYIVLDFGGCNLLVCYCVGLLRLPVHLVGLQLGLFEAVQVAPVSHTLYNSAYGNRQTSC